MPYTTIYVDDGKGVLKTGSGIVTSSELFSAALQQGIEVERTRKLHYALVDFSDTTEMKVTPEDIRRFVEMHHKFAAYAPGILVSVIAPDSLPYALARMWHLFSEELGWKANVFHARPDALAWLRKELLFRDDSSPTLEQFPSLRLP